MLLESGRSNRPNCIFNFKQASFNIIQNISTPVGDFSLTGVLILFIVTEVKILATTTIIPLHIGKGHTIASALAGTLDYIEDEEKTDEGRLISSYECAPETADAEFMLSKTQYFNLTGREQGDRDVIAYHARQSFRPGEVTPEEANRIGHELAMRWTKGKHSFVVCTHIDRDHIHSHIIWNSTRLDCRKKFRNFKGSSFAFRRVSDKLCLENGLSIVEDPKPSRGHYGTWLGSNKKISYQDQIRMAVDEALLQRPSDFDSFLQLMEDLGVEVLREKRLRFRVAGQKQPTLCNTLKEEYTEQAIRERIAGTWTGGDHRSKTQKYKKLTLLIDIQEKIQAGKGAGYENWAKIYNLKQSAQTLIYLQDNGLTDYRKLSRNTEEARSKFNELSDRIKELDTRLQANSDLQRHIVTYSKTRNVYSEYKSSGYSKKFKQEHEADILLHQTSKKAFDELGYGKDKRLPRVAELREEYAQCLAEKRKLFGEYKQTRTDMRELLTAKANVDRLLGSETVKYEKQTPEIKRGETSR